MGWCVGVRALILNGLVTKPMEWSAQKYKTKIWLRKYGSNMHPALIQLGSTPFFHTHLFVTHNFVTHNYFTHNIVSHNCFMHNCHAHTICHTQLFPTHTHTTLSRTTLPLPHAFLSHSHTHTQRVTPRYFAWRTWHLVTLMVFLRGTRGIWWHWCRSCVATVALGDSRAAFAWQAWHLPYLYMFSGFVVFLFRFSSESRGWQRQPKTRIKSNFQRSKRENHIYIIYIYYHMCYKYYIYIYVCMKNYIYMYVCIINIIYNTYIYVCVYIYFIDFIYVFIL